MDNYHEPQYSFKFKTRDISPFLMLMYGLCDLTKKVRLYVDPTGIRISEQTCQMQVLLSGFFHASKFEEFECKGRVVISVRPDHVYRAVCNHHESDEMTWVFNHKKPNKIRIEIGTSGNEYHWEVPNLKSVDQMYEAMAQDVDYCLVYDSNLLTAIFKNFSQIDEDFRQGWIEISSTPKRIIFQMRSNTLVRIGRVTLRMQAEEDELDNVTKENTKKRNRNSKNTEHLSHMESDMKRKLLQDEVVHQFKLQHIDWLTKLFSMSRGNSVCMYFKSNYPLMFEVRVGSLGSLRMAVMFRHDNQ